MLMRKSLNSKEKIRLLIAFLRLYLLIVPIPCGIIITLVAFIRIDPSLTSDFNWRMVPMIFWSLFTALAYQQLLTCQLAVVMIVFIACRVLILETKSLRVDRKMSLSKLSHRDRLEIIMRKIELQLQLVTRIRNYNQSIKWMIGFLMAYFFNDTIIIFWFLTLFYSNQSLDSFRKESITTIDRITESI